MMKHDPEGATATRPRNGELRIVNSELAQPANGRASANSKFKIQNSQFGDLQFHPLVLSFPRLSDEKLDELAEEMRMRGGAVSILRVGEIILDDRNKVLACERAGLRLEFCSWDGGGSLVETIARASLPRANLSESQRAAIAVPISDELAAETLPGRNRANLIPGGPPTRNGNGNGANGTLKTPFPESYSNAAKVQRRENETKSPEADSSKISDDKTLLNAAAVEEQKRLGRAAERAAQLCSVSPRYVYEAKKLRDFDAKLFGQVLSGQMNLSAARVAISKKQREKSLANCQPMRSTPQKGGDELIVGDCLSMMAKMPDGGVGGVDLVFADPPYNLGWTYDADPTHDLLPAAKYLDWCERWIKHCARLLKATGSFFILTDSRWQARTFVMLENSGLHWRNTIVWRDPFPTHTDQRFQPSARFIHYFAKSTKHFTFNADAVRVPSRRDEIGDARRVHDKGIVPHDVWDEPRIVGNSKERVPFEDAPPQVPAAILERIILACSNEGDRVFDPFTGNGTTWRAARKLGRKFTGIERSEKYAEQARQWAFSE